MIELLDVVGPLTDPTAHGGSAGGRVRPRAAVGARLRLLGRAGRGRLGRRPHRGRLGGADATSRLCQLCGPGRRRGRRRHRRDEPPGARGPDRRSHEPARARAEQPRGPAGGHRAGKGGARRDQDVPDERQRLLRGAVHQAPDHRLRVAGLPRRTRGVDGGPRHGRLLQDRARLHRRQAVGQPHPRPHPRQRHDLLADRHRRVGGQIVLGGLRADAPAAGQKPLPASSIPFGFTTFPGEIWRTPRSWVEASYPNVVYFNEVDKGGHFAAWEQPQLFSEEVRAAFRSLR